MKNERVIICLSFLYVLKIESVLVFLKMFYLAKKIKWKIYLKLIFILKIILLLMNDVLNYYPKYLYYFLFYIT